MPKTIKKPSIDDYDEGLGINKEEITASLIEIGEMIDQKLERPPKTRDKMAWKQWRSETNFLISIYNERANYKAYKNVH